MKEEERKQLLSFMSTDKYRDIINVCASFPLVKMKVKYLGNKLAVLISYLDFLNTKVDQICFRCKKVVL